MLEVATFAAQVVAAAVGAYAAIKVELRWLRRDVDHAHERIDRHDSRLLDVERRV